MPTRESIEDAGRSTAARPAAAGGQGWRRRGAAWLLLLGLAVTIMGARAHMIFRYGTDVPYWDQWVREGEMMIAPHYEGTLRWQEYFVPHSEHRIAPTLAVNMALVVLSGQWDERVECLVNAALAAAIALALVAFARRRYGPRWAVGLAAGLAGFNALPLVWENILGGFQSQFYFLIGFSLLAMYGLLQPTAWRSGRWWVGLLAAAAASVSMGSGFLCLAPVAVIAAWRLVIVRRRMPQDGTTLVVAVAGLAAGWHFRAPAPWHAALHAHHAGEFMLYVGRCLAWPRPELPWFGVCVWLPFLGLLFQCVHRRNALTDDRVAFPVAAGLWTLGQVAALAYGRGAGATDPASRYGDVLAIGAVAGWLALAVTTAGAGRMIRVAATGVWMAALLVAAVASSVPSWQSGLPDMAARNRRYEQNVAAYLRTGDLAAIQQGEVPFPFRDWLKRMLDRPAIRAVMPASVRVPVPISAAPGGTGFKAGGISPATAPLRGLASWGSYGKKGAATWSSQPVISPRSGYWRIEMAGAPDKTDVRVGLRGTDGRIVGRIAPTRTPGDTWRSAYVRVPAGSVVLQATDASAHHWVGFSAPVEESTLSEAARQICRLAPMEILFGLVLFGAGALLLVRPEPDRAA